MLGQLQQQEVAAENYASPKALSWDSRMCSSASIRVNKEDGIISLQIYPLLHVWSLVRIHEITLELNNQKNGKEDVRTKQAHQTSKRDRHRRVLMALSKSLTPPRQHCRQENRGLIECHNCEDADEGHCKTESPPINSNLEHKLRNRDNARHFARKRVLA
jgi:hypothetical protein